MKLIGAVILFALVPFIGVALVTLAATSVVWLPVMFVCELLKKQKPKIKNEKRRSRGPVNSWAAVLLPEGSNGHR